MRLLLLSLIACGRDETAPSVVVSPDTLDADIQVDPTALSFLAELGGAADTETVTVTNAGGATLQIVGIGFDSAETSDVFDVSTLTTIEPGESATFDVTFSPTAPGAVAGELSVLSNDPDAPEVVVTLDGQVAAPELELDPELSELGTTYVGCTALETITLTNVGTADLVVTDLEYVTVGTDFTLDGGDSGLPWTLAPSESRYVYFNYAPLDEEADEGILQVTSNDPLRPEANAIQRGDATIYAENIDTFDLSPVVALDVLFVVDNSAGSYVWEGRTVASAGPFLDALALHDYRIAVITTDSPEFVADVVTPATPDAEAALEAALAVGSGGDGAEMPSEMAYQATVSGGDGEDFPRAGAGLALIVVSDDSDSSPGAWGDYLSHFQDLPERPEDFIAHAIAGDWPTGCSTASATNNVYEMTVATGGLYLSICEPAWDDHMDAIVAETLTGNEGFELSGWPVVETIEVWLDGVLLEGGWTYNATDRSMEFDEGVLPEVGTVEVTYVVYGDCED